MSDQEERIKISFETNADQTKQSVDGVANSVNKTTDAVEQQTQAQVSLRQQLRNANIELQNTINKYGETSKEAIASAKAVANLKDQMEFAQQLSKSFNPDQKFKALTSASQLAGTGLQGVTSGMALFGDQSKETQQQLLKVQAAMAFSDAISNLSNLNDQWKVLKTAISQSSVATKLHTATMGTATIVQKAFGGAVDTTSFSFKALKVAIAGTGIGLLVTGVAMLVNNFDDLKAIVFKAVPQLEAVGKVITGIVQSVTDFLGLTSEADRVIDKQKAKAEKALKQNEKYLQLNEHKLSESQKRKLELENEHWKRVSEGTISNQQSLKILNEKKAIDEINALKKENEEKDRLEKEARDKRIAKQKEDQAERKRLQEEAKKERERILQEGAKKELELQQQLQDLQDDSEESKLERQKQREQKALNEQIEQLKKYGQDTTNLQATFDAIWLEKFNDFEAEKKTAREQKQKEFLDGLKLEDEAIKEYQDQKFEFELEDIYNKTLAKIEADKEAKQLESEAMGGTPEEIEQRKRAIDDYFKEEQLKAEENFTNGKIDLKKRENDALNGLGNQAVGLAKDIFAKNKNIQKGILIAESGVAIGKVAKNTVEGVSKAISASPLTVGMPWSGIIGAKGILDTATIISSTNKALQSLGGGSVSGGGASQPSTPTGVSAQPQIGVQASQENQIATSIATVQTEQPPIKAFVVSSDVTTAQNLDAKIIQENSF